MEFLKEFFEENKEWINPALAAFVGAFVSWLTSLFRTRASRLEDLIDGKKVYDDNDLVRLPNGQLVELGSLYVVRKGKNADEKESH